MEQHNDPRRISVIARLRTALHHCIKIDRHNDVDFQQGYAEAIQHVINLIDNDENTQAMIDTAIINALQENTKSRFARQEALLDAGTKFPLAESAKCHGRDAGYREALSIFREVMKK